MSTAHKMKHKVDPLTEQAYSQCENCGKVCLQGDGFFNMVCLEAAKEIQRTRERLEKTQVR